MCDLRKDEEQDTHEDGGGGGAHGYLHTLHCPHLHIKYGPSYPSSYNDFKKITIIFMCMFA